MKKYQDNIVTPAIINSQIFYARRSSAKRYTLQEKACLIDYSSALPEEIIEQCLALVHALIECHDPHVTESLAFILEERLLQLQRKCV